MAWLSRVVASGCVGVLIAGASGCFFFDTGSDEEEPPPPPPPNLCADSSEPTPGELGLLEFVYDWGSISCLFGCSASEPIAERAQVELVAVGDVDLPPVMVRSDAPDVAEFDIGEDGDIHVTTYAAGQARLEIYDGVTEELLEALTLTVKPVSEVTRDEEGALQIMIGGAASVPLSLRDELGCRMVGVGGVDYSLEGGISESEVTLTDALASWLFEGIFGSAVTESFSVDALALGSGEIRVRAPSGAELEIPVAVVDESAAHAISLSASSPMTVGSSYSVNARAVDAAGVQIHSPACEWTLSPVTGPVEVSSEARDAIYVLSDAAGGATVSCRVGDAVGELAVTFQ